MEQKRMTANEARKATDDACTVENLIDDVISEVACATKTGVNHCMTGSIYSKSGGQVRWKNLSGNVKTDIISALKELGYLAEENHGYLEISW